MPWTSGYANCGVDRPNFADSAPIVADVNTDPPGDDRRGNVCNCGTSRTRPHHMPFILTLDRTRWSRSGFGWTAIHDPGVGAVGGL
jgi:hypothetical protein